MFPKVLNTLWALLFILCALSKIGYSQRLNVPEMPVPIEDHIRQMGYPVETHKIQTEDGYVLTYHRIPYGKLHTANETRPAVLIQHGVLALSHVWVVVNDSLGFALADAGYDVWLANSRGTYYSRKHIWYDPVKDKKEFWDFSWHEMGKYDLPAAIDYILQTTGNSELSFVGHSMGNTMYFVLGATRPEYMSKITVSALMAPVAYLKNMHFFFETLSKLRAPLGFLTKVFGLYEFLPYNEFFYLLINDVCGNKDSLFLCKDVIGFICGFDNDEFDWDLVTAYLAFMPGGTSTKTMLHYGQIIDKGFKQYDYGPLGNLKKYHSFLPPNYKLRNVEAPTHFYLAANDGIVSPNVAIYTAQKMPNLQGLKIVNNINFNHADFMWAKDIKSLVYNDLIDTIKKYL